MGADSLLGGWRISVNSKSSTMVPAALFLLLTGALAKPPPMGDDGNFTMDGIILERGDENFTMDGIILERYDLEDRAINTCDSIIQDCWRKGSKPKVPTPLPGSCLSDCCRRWKLPLWRNNCQQEVHHHCCSLHRVQRGDNHKCEGGDR